jgi:hypothetical protein
MIFHSTLFLRHIFLRRWKFFVLRPGKPTGRVDHVAIGVDNFNEASRTADLKARGATPIPSTAANKALGLDFHVVDPDRFPFADGSLKQHWYDKSLIIVALSGVIPIGLVRGPLLQGISTGPGT